MILPYRAKDFPATLGPALQGSAILDCTWSDLTWAAITVGRPSWAAVFQHGWYSSLECVYRAAMLWANLKASWNSPPRISRSSAFADLDPSEKTAISYYFGLTIAKLLAARLLNAPWPQHLDRFSGSLSPSLSRKERPDLVARDNIGRWIVLEAKGRSNTLRPKTMTKAKQQVQALQEINGGPVYLRVAVGTYFAKRNLQAEIHDPPEETKKRAVLKIDDEEFIRDYYAPLASLFHESAARPWNQMIENGLTFKTVVFPEIDITVGLAEPILAHYEREDRLNDAVLSVAKTLSPEIEARGTVKGIDQPGNRAKFSSLTIGRDGVLVALGPAWSDDQMRLDPTERNIL